jgi:hypothetical protein
MPVREKLLPAAAQTRKAATVSISPMPSDTLDQRAPPRRNWRTPRKARIAATK